MSTATDTSYGQASLTEKAGAFVSGVLHLPLVLGYTLITSPLHPTNKHKSWKRVIGDKALNHFTERLSARQLQWTMGTSKAVYETWAKASKLPIIIDELGEGGRLFWIGERKTDKVILYIHGGGFHLPVQDSAASFWKYVKDALKTKDKDVGLVILSYSLVPTANFPTQLHQAVLGVKYLLSNGLSPSSIQITGDSAGGNLALQLLSHILHPVPSVPALTLDVPFAGVYLMSPWVTLSPPPNTSTSFHTNSSSDMIGPRGITDWGQRVLDGLPDAALPYIDPGRHAPKDWFADIALAADRVLVTAGESECLRDEIVRFGQGLCAVHPRARLVVQDHGVHDDPHLDFFLPTWEKVEDKEQGKDRKEDAGRRWRVKVGALTPLIIEWFEEGFKE